MTAKDIIFYYIATSSMIGTITIGYTIYTLYKLPSRLKRKVTEINKLQQKATKIPYREPKAVIIKEKQYRVNKKAAEKYLKQLEEIKAVERGMHDLTSKYRVKGRESSNVT